ncbi:MAG: hypothetical protein F9K25_19315 [Candidatus Contendobacter sp.]|nr:MAG: hypothetical protein F9K25_19315 [Candidatus Contendobacter sp.]
MNQHLAVLLRQDQHPTARVPVGALILPTAEILADGQHLDLGPALGPQSIPSRGDGLVLQRPELGAVVEIRSLPEQVDDDPTGVAFQREPGDRSGNRRAAA